MVFKKYKNELFFIILTLFLLIFFIFWFYSPTKVSAAPASNVLPNDANWMIVTRPGTNGMDAALSRAQIVTPEAAGRTQRLVIESACDNDSNIDSPRSGYYTTFRFYKSSIENVTAVSANVSINNTVPYFEVRCTSGSSITLDMRYTTSSLNNVGGVRLYETEVVTSVSGGSLYYANSYRFRASNTSVRIGISDVANPGGDPVNYTGLAYQNVISQPRGWGWSTTIEFALPCDVKTGLSGQTINFYDTDHNESVGGNSMDPWWQNRDHRMSYTVEQRSVGSSVWTPVVSENLNGGDDVDEQGSPFTMYPQNIYRLRVTGINYVNSIQIALPQPSIFSGINCPPQPQMSCGSFTGLTATSPGGYMEVTFRIYNETNFTWVASGFDYDIGVVDPSFAGAYVDGSRTTFPWNTASSNGIGPPDHNSAAYIENSANGTQNTWHRESYNRNANDGSTPHSVERYGTNVNIAPGGYRTFSVRVAAPTVAGGSRTYGIRMLSRDTRFRPWAWMNWSSTCSFTVNVNVPATNWDYNSTGFSISTTSGSSSNNAEGASFNPGARIYPRGRVRNAGDGSGPQYRYQLERRLENINGDVSTWSDGGVGWGIYDQSGLPALAPSAYAPYREGYYDLPATYSSFPTRQVCFRARISPAAGQSTPTLTTTVAEAFSNERCLTIATPTTSCTASNVSGFVGQSISFSANVTISGSSAGYTLKGHHRINAAAYSPWGNITGTTFTGSESFSTAGNRTITIQVGLFSPSTAGSPTSGTTSTCSLTISVYSLPTCTSPSSFDVWAGQDFRSSVRVTNSAGISLDVTTLRYTINSPSSIDRTITTNAADVPASSSRVYSYGSSGGSLHYEDITTPGNYTITWYIDTADAGPVRNSSGSNCTTTVQVRALPTCTARVWYQEEDGSWAGPPRTNYGFYGREIGSGVEINMGHDSIDQSNSSANYTYVNANGLRSAMQGTTINPNSNPSYSGTDSTATQSGTVYTYNTPENVRVWLPKAYSNQVSWNVSWESPARSVSNEYERRAFSATTTNCTEDVDIRISAITCTNGSNEFYVGQPGRASLSINNPNIVPPPTFSNYTVKIIGQTWTDSGPNNGDVQNQTSSSPETYDRVQNSPLVLDTGTGAGVVYSGEITYATTGTRRIDFTLSAGVGVIGDSTNSITGSPAVTSTNCYTEVTVARRPYMRLYGNDVVSGSVLVASGTECTSALVTGVSDVDVTSVGNIDSSNYYHGSAAELATIATGRIRNFLPGTGSYRTSGSTLYPNNSPLRSDQNFTSGYDYLAIGGGGIGIDDIGGDYSGGGLCNEIFPDTSDWNDGGPLMGNGFRKRSSSQTIGTTTINAGTRVSLHVTGDVTITGSGITYNTAGWSTTADIPLVRIYATGNIYISGSVSQLDGLYVAGGTIETCDEFNDSSLTVAQIVATCGDVTGTRPLTLRGAFFANNVIFGRTGGDVSMSNPNPTSSPETSFSGGTKAENLIFFPELYLALWDLAGDDTGSSSGGDPNGNFDYISSPPPVF